MTLGSRAQYWRDELREARRAIAAWALRQGLLADTQAVMRTVKTATSIADRAASTIERWMDFRDVSHFDRTVQPLIEGVYLQLNEEAPNWSEPFRETARDVVETGATAVRTATTWGAGGAGVAIVAILAFLAWRELR